QRAWIGVPVACAALHHERGLRHDDARRAQRLLELDHALAQLVALADEIAGDAERPARERDGEDADDELEGQHLADARDEGGEQRAVHASSPARRTATKRCAESAAHAPATATTPISSAWACATVMAPLSVAITAPA